MHRPHHPHRNHPRRRRGGPNHRAARNEPNHVPENPEDTVVHVEDDRASNIENFNYANSYYLLEDTVLPPIAGNPELRTKNQLKDFILNRDSYAIFRTHRPPENANFGDDYVARHLYRLPDNQIHVFAKTNNPHDEDYIHYRNTAFLQLPIRKSFQTNKVTHMYFELKPIQLGHNPAESYYIMAAYVIRGRNNKTQIIPNVGIVHFPYDDAFTISIRNRRNANQNGWQRNQLNIIPEAKCNDKYVNPIYVPRTSEPAGPIPAANDPNRRRRARTIAQSSAQERAPTIAILNQLTPKELRDLLHLVHKAGVIPHSPDGDGNPNHIRNRRITDLLREFDEHDHTRANCDYCYNEFRKGASWILNRARHFVADYVAQHYGMIYGTKGRPGSGYGRGSDVRDENNDSPMLSDEELSVPKFWELLDELLTDSVIRIQRFYKTLNRIIGLSVMEIRKLKCMEEIGVMANMIGRVRNRRGNPRIRSFIRNGKLINSEGDNCPGDECSMVEIRDHDHRVRRYAINDPKFDALKLFPKNAWWDVSKWQLCYLLVSRGCVDFKQERLKYAHFRREEDESDDDDNDDGAPHAPAPIHHAPRAPASPHTPIHHTPASPARAPIHHAPASPGTPYSPLYGFNDTSIDSALGGPMQRLDHMMIDSNNLPGSPSTTTHVIPGSTMDVLPPTPLPSTPTPLSFTEEEEDEEHQDWEAVALNELYEDLGLNEWLRPSMEFNNSPSEMASPPMDETAEAEPNQIEQELEALKKKYHSASAKELLFQFFRSLTNEIGKQKQNQSFIDKVCSFLDHQEELKALLKEWPPLTNVSSSEMKSSIRQDVWSTISHILQHPGNDSSSFNFISLYKKDSDLAEYIEKNMSLYVVLVYSVSIMYCGFTPKYVAAVRKSHADPYLVMFQTQNTKHTSLFDHLNKKPTATASKATRKIFQTKNLIRPQKNLNTILKELFHYWFPSSSSTSDLNLKRFKEFQEHQEKFIQLVNTTSIAAWIPQTKNK
jgi:hypothetical protein